MVTQRNEMQLELTRAQQAEKRVQQNRNEEQLKNDKSLQEFRQQIREGALSAQRLAQELQASQQHAQVFLLCSLFLRVLTFLFLLRWKVISAFLFLACKFLSLCLSLAPIYS